MESMQQVLSVLFVLGLLGATLYWVRRRGWATLQMKGTGRRSSRVLRSVERLPLTAQHSLHLIAVGNRMLLVGVSPGGCTVLDVSHKELPDESGAQA